MNYGPLSDDPELVTFKQSDTRPTDRKDLFIIDSQPQYLAISCCNESNNALFTHKRSSSKNVFRFLFIAYNGFCRFQISHRVLPHLKRRKKTEWRILFSSKTQFGTRKSFIYGRRKNVQFEFNSQSL